MPTLAGLRRRGYTPEALKLFCERSGTTKTGGAWTEYAALEAALRDTLDPIAPRAMAVLDPLALEITNWDATMGAGHLEPCHAPVNPHDESAGPAETWRRSEAAKPAWAPGAGLLGPTGAQCKNANQGKHEGGWGEAAKRCRIHNDPASEWNW